MFRMVTLGRWVALRVTVLREEVNGFSETRDAAVRVSAHCTRILSSNGIALASVKDRCRGVEPDGSTIKSALCMACRALGEARNISGIDLFTVSFALFARSARRFWFGGMTVFGWSRPIATAEV